MKKISFRIFVIITAVLLFAALGSCNMPASGTQGGLEIMLPSRAADPMYDRPGETYYVRVFLVFNNAIYPLKQNTPYLEAAITNEQRSITLDAIPAGTFRLCLGIGTKNDIGAFVVEYYSESEEFTLVAGSTVDVNCPTLLSPFTTADGLLELNTKGVVALDGFVFTATKNYVYRYSLDTGFSLSGTTGYPDSSTINSITAGLRYIGATAAPENCLYLSTSTGIALCDTSLNINNTFSSASGLASVNVVRTLAYPDGYNVTLYFQRKGGFGGVYYDGSPSWANVDHSSFVKGEFVRDFTVTSGLSPNYSFFSTALGTFRLPTSVLSTYSTGNLQFLSSANFFKIVKSGKELPILSLGFDPDGSARLYIGTNDGVYYAQVGGPGSALAATPVLLPVTANNKITQIAINNNYRVFASNSYIFVQRKMDDFIVTLPAIAGLPGTITGLAWYGDILMVSGTEGLAALNPDTLPFPAY